MDDNSLASSIIKTKDKKGGTMKIGPVNNTTYYGINSQTTNNSSVPKQKNPIKREWDKLSDNEKYVAGTVGAIVAGLIAYKTGKAVIKHVKPKTIPTPEPAKPVTPEKPIVKSEGEKGKPQPPVVSEENPYIKQYEDYDKQAEEFMKSVKDPDKMTKEEHENYRQKLGIPCSLKEGRTETDNKVVAYCVFRGLEIMRQLKLPLPAKIPIGDTAKSNSLAECYYYPDIMKNYPIGTVVYNKMQDWANLLKNSVAELNQNTHFHTTCHFMHTTIHEFGHNVHFNKLYSKFGSPVPDSRFPYNPAVKEIMDKLNMKLYDDSGRPINNPYVTTKVRNIMKQSSGYGSSLLPELFAEEFANAIIYNMNFMTLKMIRNPFPIKGISPELQQVLNETWEGLIGDGKGLI